jgi:transcriptional regulator GlxA family with amidase domain
MIYTVAQRLNSWIAHYENRIRAGPRRLRRLGTCFSSRRVETDVWIFCEDNWHDLRNSREHGWAQSDADLPLSAFVSESADILILPGGESWTNREMPKVSEVVRVMGALSRPVRAICAATLALAHGGLLDERLHTSNGKNFIGKYVPDYRGEEFYRASPAVRDRCVITANGLAPFAFAAEIFRALAPEREHEIETYEKLYSRGLFD